VRARAPHDHDPFHAGTPGRPNDGGGMLYARDVQESLYAAECSVEIPLYRGVASEDLHPLRVEP
jgi:hypothetical protein